MASSELHNVVIIGLGSSGVVLAKVLSKSLPPTHRVVAISASSSCYYPIAALRGIVAEGWEENSVSLDGFFPAGSRHVVLAGTRVVEIQKDAHTLVVDRENAALGFGTEIGFDYCVVATGSDYAFPCRPPPTAEESTVRAVRTLLKATQKDVADSKSILIVGGGPVGIEFAGEVKAFHPGKQVTLVHSHNELIQGEGLKPGVHKKLLKQLEGLGIKVVLGKKLDTDGLQTGRIQEQTFNLGEAGSVKADFIMIAYGCIPNTSLISNFNPSLLSSSTHRIKVKETLQIDSPNNVLDHIFAIGDATDVQETKLAYYAQNHAQIAAKNILSLVYGKTAAAKYKPGSKAMLISIGPNGGAGQLFGFVLGPWFVSMVKSKTLGVDKFRAILKT